LLDYLHEVEHATARIARLDGAIEEAVKVAPPKMRAVIEALQALRGIAHVSAVTVVAELGELSRFARAKQLMGYGGIVAREDSSGERTRRGSITKTGNAHLRRVVIEAARSPTDTDLPWEPLCASGKSGSAKRSKKSLGKHNSGYISGIGSCWPRARTGSCGHRRELLGFIWAIGIKVETAQKESLQRAA